LEQRLAANIDDLIDSIEQIPDSGSEWWSELWLKLQNESAAGSLEKRSSIAQQIKNIAEQKLHCALGGAEKTAHTTQNFVDGWIVLSTFMMVVFTLWG
jgi:hypothetical protein